MLDRFAIVKRLSEEYLRRRRIACHFLTFCYQGTALMNDHMNGEFPVLKPGMNAISWTGTVTKVVVKPNWRFL